VITRRKNGIGGRQHLATAGLRALRVLRTKSDGHHHVFVSEKGGPLTPDAFAKQLAAIGERGSIGDFVALIPCVIRPGMSWPTPGRSTPTEYRRSWAIGMVVAPMSMCRAWQA
jgi:hypothetical protein